MYGGIFPVNSFRNTCTFFGQLLLGRLFLYMFVPCTPCYLIYLFTVFIYLFNGLHHDDMTQSYRGHNDCYHPLVLLNAVSKLTSFPIPASHVPELWLELTWICALYKFCNNSSNNFNLFGTNCNRMQTRDNVKSKTRLSCNGKSKMFKEMEIARVSLKLFPCSWHLAALLGCMPLSLVSA